MNQEPTVQLPPLPVSHINLLLEGLNGLPHGRSRGLFDLVAGTAQKQLNPKLENPKKRAPSPAKGQSQA